MLKIENITLKTITEVKQTSSPVSTLMGDRLGIPGAVDFCLLFSFFIICSFIIIIQPFFLFSFFFSLIVFCFYYFYKINMNFSIQSRKIGFFNAEASACGHPSYILQYKNNDNYFKI